MPTFYCNSFFAWHSGAPYTRGPPGLCLPCLPHCYATAYARFIVPSKIEQQLLAVSKRNANEFQRNHSLWLSNCCLWALRL